MSRSRLLLPVALVIAACGGENAGPDAEIHSVCTDGLDNDGDGSIDYPADPGCDNNLDNDETNAPIAMCSDTRDNDGDGLIDFPNDPGCYTPLQNSEDDDCPDGPMCPGCSNGMDDDMDGGTDFPTDIGCSAASDDDEWETNPNACGPGLTVTRLMTHDVTVMLPQTPSLLAAGPVCGGAGGGGEVAFEILITQPSVLVATTDSINTAANTVLYLRRDCLMPPTEIVCNDDISTMNNKSKITAELDPGIYYLVIDAQSSGSAGQAALHVDYYNGRGVPCTIQGECGPGLQCRVPVGGTEMVCTDPMCDDGFDSDLDTKNDYPEDPGCDSPDDFDEADTCPAGPNCPACGDGVDNDLDLLTDYPADPDCTSASQPVEGCGVEDDPIFTLTDSPGTDNLVGLMDDFDLTCDGLGGLDRVWFVLLPQLTTMRVDTIGSPTDTVVAVYPSSCSGTALGCNDDSGGAGTSLLNLTNIAAGAYAIVVENYSTGFPPGPYTLNVTGTIAAGGNCTVPLAASGDLTCPTGYACIGGVCLGNLQCNNGMDDDGDSKNDFPNDPGCSTPTDNVELDDCPAGPMCPACSNGVDDDMDGQTDYPMDTDCTYAGGTAEVCGVETDPLVIMTTPTITGMTTGFTPNFTLSCGFNTAGSPDRVALVTLPAMTSFHIDMMGSNYDAVLALKTAACGAATIACHDGFPAGTDQINTGVLAAGQYAIIIDGYNGLSGNYTVNVTGKIANDQSCESPLAVAGALTCNAGYACKGTPGSRSCQRTQCNDTINNDADTKIDYPNDPGCADTNDDDEADNCPAGPGCPVCGDALDNDGDLLIDYPMDYGCVAASGGSEVACQPETDPIAVITMPVHNNTTAGRANNFTPSCSFGSNAPDLTYIFQVPVQLTNLTIDTLTSPFNTVLTWDEPTCTAPTLNCDDNGGTNLTSRLNLTNVAPGAYAITVDGNGTANGNFALHVDGRAAPGSACTSPLFVAGVLACSVGQTCIAGMCQ